MGFYKKIEWFKELLLEENYLFWALKKASK
jgi:hypothetical protein